MEQNTYLTKVIKEIGMSTSKVTAINKGSIPNAKTLQSLSLALKCPISAFFMSEEDLPYDKEKTSHNEDERDMLRIYNQLDRVGKHKLMSAVYEFEVKE